MKKGIIWGHWFYFFGAIVLISVTLLYNVLFILLIIAQPNNITTSVPALLFGIINFVYIIILTCNFLIQVTVISEEGVKTRSVWRTIRALKWEQVKEVRYERFYISVKGGFSSGWFVFDDGEERKQLNGLVRKNSHITGRATKRARKIIEMFWHGPIVEKDVTAE